MSKFWDFLEWYNHKDVDPTLEAIQKMIEFYHDKGRDMLKPGCTLPNLANICLQKSTDYKFYTFFSSDSDLLEKNWEDMTGGPSIVFRRKAIANETLFENQTTCVNQSTMKKHKNSRQGKIEFDYLKIWSCQTFEQPELIVKL